MKTCGFIKCYYALVLFSSTSYVKCQNVTLCGIQKNVNYPSPYRIFGGGNARSGNYPWLVSIRRGNVHICGGSIISERWILTSARCVTDRSKSHIAVAGTHYKNNQDLRGTIHRIIRAIQHPQYNSRTMIADVCLMYVDPPFRFRDGDNNGVGAISPICLADKHQLFNNKFAIVAGFGRSSGFQKVNQLKAAVIRILNPTYCERVYKYSYYFDKRSMICAGYLNGGIDACSGDSGGPLAVMADKRVTQIGIVSFGYGCARKGYPGVYTRVTAVRNWIQSQTGIGVQP